ncbi:MAG: 4-phosphoerythronate dehydrogenase [Balneola sp.]
MLKILADKNIYKLAEFLPDEVDLSLYDPNEPLPSLNDYQALLCRTVTKLNSETIPVIPDTLKFLGTGSSGSDHIDIKYFEQHGINVIDAKGSNANAVSEFVITSLLLWGIKRKKDIHQLKVGIIGAGATGTAVSKQLSQFGISNCSYDPPRELRDKNFNSASLQDILECDILTFHVPLTKTGEHSTYHWLDQSKLNGNTFKLVINAARGGVIDELALLTAIQKKTVSDIIIDVWEGEPDFNTALVEKAFIATPHIAGYSEQAKLNASKILAEKLADFFNLKLPDYSDLYTPKKMDIANLNYSLYELILRLHPLREYDADIRELCLRPDKAILFQKLRTDRDYRFEYPHISLKKSFLNKFVTLIKLGIKPCTNI